MLLISPTKNAAKNLKVRGVEILLSSKRYKSLRIYASVPKSSFKENPWTNLICCHRSTNTFEENETKNFFFNLTFTFFGEAMLKHNLISMEETLVIRLDTQNQTNNFLFSIQIQIVSTFLTFLLMGKLEPAVY